MPIKKINIEDLFEIPTAVIYNPDDYKPARYVSIDSRNVKKNSIFFAIKGENFDGHAFVNNAVKMGAETVVINKKQLKHFDNLKAVIVTVDDTIKAYGNLARIWRKKLNAKVVSLTGSNGKTTSKEMIATLLAEKFKVVKTRANNNNHIGVPLTIFDADAKTEVIVLEHGTNHFNEIEYTAKIALPDMALITNIGSSHLEFLKDKQGVFKEKKSLLIETASCGGKILINIDDPLLRPIAKEFKNKTTFGFTHRPDVKGKIAGYTPDGRTKIEIADGRKKIKAILPVCGISNAKNFLIAYTVAVELGLTKNEILCGIKKLSAVKGRLRVIRKKNLMLIDDTYNSNPESVKSGIELVETIKTHKRKVLLMGDMFELGRKSKKLHEDLSRFISKNKISDVYLIGKYMKALNDKLAKAEVNTKHFKSREVLNSFLQGEDFAGSVILVKGSRGMHMEEFLSLIEKKAL